MFDNLNVRNKFLAVTAVPVNVAVIVAVWAALAGQTGIAALAVAGAVATTAAAFALAGSVVSRLAALGDEAEHLAAERLPAILTDLAGPAGASAGASPAVAPRAEGPGDPDGLPGDEISRISAGLATIEHRVRSAVEARAAAVGAERAAAEAERAAVEAERAAIEAERADVETERAGAARQLGGLIQNLARRSQSLLDRQIEHLDWLEAKEQDPERLEQLFKLDHLATRMRRSSESVLVLGGADPTRQRGGPAPVADVLRVAMGETEDYRNIRLRTVDPVLIAGTPAFELAHLLAEVLENATQFSPPDVPVELHATVLDDGRYRITVIDRGVGMDEAKLARANATIADPPEISLTMGNSVGFIVIGRLAHRLGATVELTATPTAGVTAEITVPASVIVERIDDDTEPAADAEPPAPAAPAAPEAATPAPLDKLVGLQADLPEAGGWEPPKVGGKEAKPLRAREAAPATAATTGPDPDDAESRADAPDATGTASAATPERTTSAGTAPAGTTTAGATPAGATPEATASEISASEISASEGSAPQGTTPEDEAEGEDWTPPLPPERRSGPDRPARTLAEAIPTGSAFDTGVDSLLASVDDDDEPTGPAQPADADTDTDTDTDETWTPPEANPATGGGGTGLTRRDRGAQGPQEPPTKGQGARASNRSAAEKRSMLTSYRAGLKGTKGPDDGATTPPDAISALVSEATAVADATADTTIEAGPAQPAAAPTPAGSPPANPAPRADDPASHPGGGLPGRSAKPSPRRTPRSDRRPNQEGN